MFAVRQKESQINLNEFDEQDSAKLLSESFSLPCHQLYS